jgi:hypothetical protein
MPLQRTVSMVHEAIEADRPPDSFSIATAAGDLLLRAEVRAECFEAILDVVPEPASHVRVERFLMQLLALPNIRLSTLFPRDQTRLTP